MPFTRGRVEESEQAARLRLARWCWAGSVLLNALVAGVVVLAYLLLPRRFGTWFGLLPILSVPTLAFAFLVLRPRRPRRLHRVRPDAFR